DWSSDVCSSDLWMMGNAEEAAKLAMKRAIDGQNPEINKEIITLRNNASVSDYTQIHGLGALHVESLQAAADAYYKLGLIGQQLDIESVVAKDLLPKLK